MTPHHRVKPPTVQKKGNTVEEAYQEIKKMIYYNMLAPGQKLVYQDLAKKLKMSITPIIQALNGLKRSNFVRYEPNKGYFVGEITEEEARELYEAREALESYLIPSVIRNLRGEDLSSIIKTFKGSKVDPHAGYQRLHMIRDAEFHLKIIEYAGNRTIYKLLEEIFENIYLRYRPEYLLEVRVKNAVSEHREFLRSLEEGDVRETRSLLKKHIENGMHNVIEHLRSRSSMIGFQR